MVSCLLLIKHLRHPSHFLTDLWNRLSKNLPFNIKCYLTLMCACTSAAHFITGDRKTNGVSASWSLSGSNSESSFASRQKEYKCVTQERTKWERSQDRCKRKPLLTHSLIHSFTHTHQTKPPLWKRLIKPSETCQQLDIIPLVKLLCKSTTRAFISTSTERQTGWQIFHFESYYSLTSSSSSIN